MGKKLAEFALSLVCGALIALPAFIASRRKCSEISVIYLLSFYLGWTVIGWIVAMIWALRGKTVPQDAPATK